MRLSTEAFFPVFPGPLTFIVHPQVNRIVINHSYKRKRNVLYGYDIALIELKDKIQQWTK